MLEGFRPRGMIGRVGLMCVLPCALFLTAPATAQDDQEQGKKGKKKTYIQRVSARAFSLAENTNDTVRVEIGIARWSTDEERQTLVKALVDGGTPEITKALEQSPDLGFVRFGNDYATIRYARVFPEGDKRRIVIATDRPLGYLEVSRSLRSERFTVSMADLTLDEAGRGEGVVAPLAEVRYNPETNHVDVGIFDVQPVRLTGIRGRQQAE